MFRKHKRILSPFLKLFIEITQRVSSGCILQKKIGQLIMLLSVLEQFEITKFTFNPLFYTRSGFLRKLILFFERKIFLMKKKYRSLKRFFIKAFYLLNSFFIPNSYSTKNYTFSRIVYYILKRYFYLSIKHKLVLFFRFSVQIIKLKITYKLQQAIETNFGHAYPYYTRLLNYFPYLLATFFTILLQNFDGLYFYGFTNTAFLLQNFIISFQIVVGLTLIVFLLGLIIFIKCLFLVEYQLYYYLF